MAGTHRFSCQGKISGFSDSRVHPIKYTSDRMHTMDALSACQKSFFDKLRAVFQN